MKVLSARQIRITPSIIIALITLGLLGLGLLSNSPTTSHTASLTVATTAMKKNPIAATTASTTTTTQPITAAQKPQTVATTVPQKTTATTQTPVIKYSTSPDPRSTSYSTTPPTPAPTDVNIPIIENDQVAVGTLINFNAIKNYSVYYGGNLVISSPTVVIMQSNHNFMSNPFTVTIPDGQTTNMPIEPWNDQSSIAYPATNVSAAAGSSWTLFLQLIGTPAPGTYQVHLQSLRDQGENASVEYDGFITLVVE